MVAPGHHLAQEDFITTTSWLVRGRPSRRRRRFRLGRSLVIALVGLTTLAAGCGGQAGKGVASLGKKTSTTVAAGGTATTLPPGSTVQKHFQEALKFSQCLRSHGVPNFPDPTSTGGIDINSSSGINPNNPQFQAAQKACQRYFGPRPSGAQQAQAEKQALAFAACMRDHGVPNYPDPTFGPNGAISRGDGPSGVDQNSLAFQNAVKKCNL
jgi:hypothetical protein